MSSSSPPNSFLSAPTTAGSVLTPASTISSRDPSIRTATATGLSTASTDNDSSTTRPRQKAPSGFVFPSDYDFPALFTLQPNALTRQRQMKLWADLIVDWCRYHRTFRLSLVDAVDLPLFHNARMRKRIGMQDARTIIDWMAKSQEDGGGGKRAEWLPPTPGGGLKSAVGEKTAAWIWWKRPEEWATLVADWVCLRPFFEYVYFPRAGADGIFFLKIDETAQKNTVLTVYELINGDATISQGTSA